MHRSLATLHQHLADLGGADLAQLLLAVNPARLLQDEPLFPAEPVAGEHRFPWSGLFER